MRLPCGKIGFPVDASGSVPLDPSGAVPLEEPRGKSACAAPILGIAIHPMRPLLTAWWSFAVLVAQDPLPPPGGFVVGTRDYAMAMPLGAISRVDGVATALDVYYPVGPTPATGWPCVLLVHGGSGNRNIQPIVARANLLARAGYVCFAYDVRGEGVTTNYNAPGFDASEEARLRDMAELFARSNAFLPAGVSVDTTRLAVTGESMGGRHAYRAAGWSGHPLPVPMGSYTHMPVIAAVAPRIAPLDVPGNSVRGNLLNAEAAVGIYERGPADPSYPFLVAEDFPPIAAQLAADPLRNYLPRLQSSTVPILLTNCWDDAKHELADTIAALGQLPASTPARTYWTTNGHGTQDNAIEQFANDESIRRWFDHYLKGRANGVPLEPEHESGYAPASSAAHLDPGSAWAHALEASWPPSGVGTTTLFLHSSGVNKSLTALPPIAAEQPVAVGNVLINPAYGVLAFCAADRSPASLTANVAMDSEVFTSQVLGTEMEVLGRARVTATVHNTAGDFYVTAALYAVAPNGVKKLISAGTAGVRGGAPGVHALAIDCDHTAMLVPAGYRLRLELRNLPIYDFVGNAFVRWLPCFTPSTTSVAIAPATPAQLLLPTRTSPHAFVTPRLHTESAAAGIVHTMNVYGGASRAGQTYLTLLSASGFGAGTTYGTTRLPIDLDAFTYLVLGAPTAPFFPGFAGVLDANGNTTSTVDLSLIVVPPFLQGVRFTVAVLGIDGLGNSWGGGPSEFEILP